MQVFADPGVWVGLLTLTSLELVLGIDNLIFISILAGKLPRHQRALGRRLGLGAALVTRLGLLASLAWIITLTRPLVTFLEHPFSGRDILLAIGGVFLITKASWEIFEKVERPGHNDPENTGGSASLWSVVTQISIIDIIFSLDSVIIAVGMVDNVWIMVAANLVALAVMLAASGPLSRFVERHPSVTILALAFLLLIGGNLLIEGFGYHVPKGYTYVAMGFAVGVEMLQLRYRRKAAPLVAAKGKPDIRPLRHPGDATS
jgi:predicted tellurium resistance membrane protein TerC